MFAHIFMSENDNSKPRLHCKDIAVDAGRDFHLGESLLVALLGDTNTLLHSVKAARLSPRAPAVLNLATL